MQVAELKNDTIEYQAKITIPNKEVLELINKELVTINKTAKIDGFRVGKVPASILKKKYLSSIRADIAKNQINNAIEETIKKNNLNITGDPVIEALTNEDSKDLEFTLKFELMPNITLPDFKRISIEQAKLEVSEQDVDKQIEQISSDYKSYEEESQEKAKNGDQVTIDAIGYINSEAFDGGKLDAYKLVLGSNSFIAGFEDQLINCKTGDDLTVKVNFPNTYHEKSLANKPAEFKVQVKAIHKEKSVIINDEFAKKFKCDTVEKLKEQIKKNIEASYEQPIYTMMKMQLFDQLEDMLKFNIPTSIITREIEVLQKQNQNIRETDTAIQDKSTIETDEYINKLAKRRVRIGLMLAEYIKKNILQIKEEDIQQAIISQARKYPGQERQVIEFYQNNPNSIESLKGPILEDKAVKAILAKEVMLSTKAYPKDQLEKLLDKS